MENETNQNKVINGDIEIKTTISIVIAIFSLVVFVAGLYGGYKLGFSKADSLSKEEVGQQGINNYVGQNQIAPGQKELISISSNSLDENQEIVPAPFFKSFNEDKISPNVAALETGKKYEVTFPTHATESGLGNLVVTVKRASKYYPIKKNENEAGKVYFPGCSDRGVCFDGRSYPIEVGVSNAIVAIDLQFENKTQNMFYIRGWYLSRFKVGDEYIIPKGSNIYNYERHTSTPDFYVTPYSSITATYWVEVPHNQEKVTFIYGSQVGQSATNLSLDNPLFFLPLTFDNL